MADGSPDPGEPDPESGVMPLMEHLRELRTRLVISVAAIFVGTVVGWIFFTPVFHFIQQPYIDGIAPLLDKKGFDPSLSLIGGIGSAFTFKLKVALVLGLLVTAPLWVWEIWAFILPALHRNEKRWVYLLTAVGVPLFFGGITIGYLVLPKGIQVLVGFAPDSTQVLLNLGDYLNFMLRTVLVFGVAAQIPLVVVLLNRIGAVSARQLAAARPWTIVGIFVFAAIATPSTDPLTMCFLALPMTVLYLISELIARFTDRRRAKSDT